LPFKCGQGFALNRGRLRRIASRPFRLRRSHAPVKQGVSLRQRLAEGRKFQLDPCAHFQSQLQCQWQLLVGLQLIHEKALRTSPCIAIPISIIAPSVALRLPAQPPPPPLPPPPKLLASRRVNELRAVQDPPHANYPSSCKMLSNKGEIQP
jgi:hypothetical protein